MESWRLAPAKKLRYPRYEGGFFVTVFDDDAFGMAERMRKAGVFVVPQKGAVRVALCSVAGTWLHAGVKASAASDSPLKE